MLARVEPEDRAGVDLERGQQPQAVLLGGGESSLVRQDAPGNEFLEPNSRDKSGAMQQTALEVESLRVLIDGRTRRAHEDARRQPLGERLFRCGVTVRVAAEFEPHDVVRTAFVELLLARGADQIVRRRDDARRFAGDSAVVQQRAERLDPFAEHAHFSASPAIAAAI